MARRPERPESDPAPLEHGAEPVPPGPHHGESGHAAKPVRYVIANLLSLNPTRATRLDAMDRFNEAFQKTLAGSVNMISDSAAPVVAAAADIAGLAASAAAPKQAAERRVLVVEADLAELQAKSGSLSKETVIEPEMLRVPAVCLPAALVPTMAAGTTGPGTGTSLKLWLKGAAGEPVVGAKAIVKFGQLADMTQTMVAGGISKADGQVLVPFDPNTWRPVLAAVEPTGRYWTAVVNYPQSGQTIVLQPLPSDGPFGWWQLLSGASAYNPDAGKGIKIGIIDSGVGPHPYLAHAKGIGAFVDGTFVEGAAAALDVQCHGTHVSGIIGARPPAEGGAYGGLAPGAELLMARIFTATGGGGQGDVANALDALSGHFNVDIVNMSLTGGASAIEHDAVIAAFQRGTVCVCAAGNQSGSPVGYPAAYPESIAVSALGLINTAPADTMPALNLPSSPDRFGVGGLFLGSFSNIGQSLYCTGPGNGIISTVPATVADAAPYADMSGTSMASPLVAAALAAALSKNEAYRKTDRGQARAAMAKALLGQTAMSVGLNPVYQGLGLARAG